MSRTTAARRSGVLTATVAGVLALGARPALAHETWFVHHPESYPVEWAALGRASVVVGVLAVVAVGLAWRAVARRVGSPELPALAPVGRLAPWAPRLLAVHLGASLLLLSWDRAVLDPGVGVPATALGTALLLPQAVAGLLLIAGRAVRGAALSVVAAGPVLLVLAGGTQLLMSLALLGIAVFLTVLPPSPDRGGAATLDPARLRSAVLALRVGAAGSLLVLAVVEKLANPAMARAMLEQQPLLNLLSPVGVGADEFALLAGLVEVLFAVLLLSGAAPQVVALVAAVPFTATLALFGATELVGHLPVYGVLLVLLVLGSSREHAPAVAWLPTLRRTTRPAALAR